MEIIQIDLNHDYSEAIAYAVNVLNYGGTVVYPTDTVYGLGANALNEQAVGKIFKIKKRSESKPLPIIVRNILWARELAHLSGKTQKILEKIWPGAVTAVLRKKDIVPDRVTARHKTVGMRVADHPFTDKLLWKFGYPLTATSANISGEEATRDINKVIEEFSHVSFKPDLIIDAGVLPQAEPSTILDLTGDHPKILRVGATKPEQLMKLLEL